MRNPAVQEPANDALRPLDAALQRWATDSRLASVTNDAAFLVLDRAGERILHVSGTLSALGRAVADEQGRIRPALDLSAQVRRLGALDMQPRLVRLRLDPRGIAPPLACRVASAPITEGADGLIVAPLVLPVGLRAAQARSSGREERLPAEERKPPHPVEPPRSACGRFTWRSDSEGVLTQVSGAGPSIVSVLLGKSWAAVCDAAACQGRQSLLAALADGRTFRALRVVITGGDRSESTELDISGAPTSRSNGVAPGFAGFAVVREREAIRSASKPMAFEPGASVADRTLASGSVLDAVRTSGSALDTRAPEWTDHGSSETDQRVAAAAQNDRASDLPGVASPELSSDEHAAFREIARALGARFAGDETSASVVDGLRAAIALPLSPEQATAPSTAIKAAFENLPTALLVHRDGALLFCNRRFLDLAGVTDVRAFETFSGIEALLQRPETLPAEETIALDRPGGGSIRLCIERSHLDWDGSLAEAVSARVAPEITGEACESTHEPTAQPTPNLGTDAQALLDGLPHGVVTLDRGGHVVTFNPKAAVIFAAETPSLVGKRFATLFGPEGTDVIDKSLRQAREAGTSEPRELAGLSAVPLRVRIARLFSSNEAPLYATLQDVGAPERAADDASAIRRGIDEVARRKLAFFAQASAEVRAPLGGVLSVTQAMLDEQFGPLGSERYREHLRDIHAFGGKALALVNDLVDFAGIESGQSPLAFADVPLNELVSGCVAQMQPRAARERILVRTSFASNLEPVHADERSLRQAAMNAIAHAIRLSEPGGQVIVSTMLADRGEIALRVRDTGFGMTTEEIACALEPFRADSDGTPRFSGNAGLGLTLTKALVEANRGRLRITSGKDEGTLVEMILPQRAANA